MTCRYALLRLQVSVCAAALPGVCLTAGASALSFWRACRSDSGGTGREEVRSQVRFNLMPFLHSPCGMQ